MTEEDFYEMVHRAKQNVMHYEERVDELEGQLRNAQRSYDEAVTYLDNIYMDFDND